MQVHVYEMCLSMQGFVYILLYGEPLVDTYYPSLWCMMTSIMLVDNPSLFKKAKPEVGPLFLTKVVLSKQRFYENLGRVLPDPSEFSKTALLWRSKVFEKRLL